MCAWPARVENHKMDTAWPQDLAVAQVRVARPTDKLKEVVHFYRDGIGLPQIGSFEGHAGYSGVMLGLPGRGYHLEFTQQEEGSPCPAPTRDNPVFYVQDKEGIERVVTRLARLGHLPCRRKSYGSKGSTIKPGRLGIVLLANLRY